MGRGRSATTYTLLSRAREILETIQPCSVRAVAYQLFTRGLIPSMEKTETNRISALLTWAREEDEIPFDWIVQEGRAIERVATWDDPAAYARAVQASYRRNKGAGQARDVIVVSEKGTVRGTLTPVLDTYEVNFLPVGGHTSTTRIHELAEQATPARPPRDPLPGRLRPEWAPHERGGSAPSPGLSRDAGAVRRHAGGLAGVVGRGGDELPRRHGHRVPAARANGRGYADPRPAGELPGVGQEERHALRLVRGAVRLPVLGTGRDESEHGRASKRPSRRRSSRRPGPATSPPRRLSVSQSR